MTEEEFIMRVAEMIPDLTSLVMDRARKLMDSGAIDLEEWENNYRLPKIFMQAMGKEIASQYRTTEKDMETVNNISHFL